jgi:hypothetical protein
MLEQINANGMGITPSLARDFIVIVNRSNPLDAECEWLCSVPQGLAITNLAYQVRVANKLEADAIPAKKQRFFPDTFCGRALVVDYETPSDVLIYRESATKKELGRIFGLAVPIF